MRRGPVLVLLLAMAAPSCSLVGDDAGVRAVDAQPIETAPAPPTTSRPDASTPPAGSSTGAPSSCAPDTMTPSPTGAGDELFPDLGNPGIDVQHYDVELAVDPAKPLAGVIGIDLLPTADRESLTLDTLGPQVSEVTVDGTAATFREDPGELEITPAAPLRKGRQVRVQIAYTVVTQTRIGADGVPEGWFTTPGGSYVLNEPDGARTWLPTNDHPSDTATYRFTVHTTAGRTAVANGELVSHTGDTWVWEERLPMATYLIQLLTGDYELVTATGPHGLPLVHAVLRQDRQQMQPLLDMTGEQITLFEEYFGRFPLDRYGLAITDSQPGLAMETFGRSLFSRDDLAGAGAGVGPGVGEGQVGILVQLLTSHELAHQWFGDAVTLGRWRDVWLNESFATYAQWMWLDHAGFGSVDGAAQMALDSRGNGSTADPTAEDLFGINSYEGGAVVLHALRRTIGDDAFFNVLRQWIVQFHGRSCTTGGFIALAEQVAGRDLTTFFDTWLFADHLPASFPS